MTLIELYKSILKFAGLETDKDGCVSVNTSGRAGGNTPVTIGGARLVLPTPEQLKSVNPSEKSIFHPLSENVMHGPSKVLDQLRLAINIKLNMVFGVVCRSLLQLAASPELHHKLNPDQTEVLLALPDIDETAFKNFVTLMMAWFKSNPEAAFINVYLKRGGSVAGTKYARAGITTFPIYADLVKNATSESVKLRVKDYVLFKSLYEYIFPRINVTESYNCGSDSNVAPYLDALMKTASMTAARLNDVLDLFKDYIDEVDLLTFDAEWVPVFDNLEVMEMDIKRIPLQGKNDGAVSAAAHTPSPSLMAPAVPPPNQQGYPTPPAPNQHGFVAYPSPGGGYPPPQPYAPPVPFGMQPPQAIRFTDKGIDINSLSVVNNMPNPLARNVWGPGNQPPPRPEPRPSWDRSGQPQQYQQYQPYPPPQPNYNPGYPNNNGNLSNI